jgi:DNA repair protein SbcD/Mre11
MLGTRLALADWWLLGYIAHIVYRIRCHPKALTAAKIRTEAPSMKFIHTADIHLDSPLHRLAAYDGVPADTVRQASRRAFENLIGLAIAEAVDLVLIAGDLFDGDWKDYNTGLYFVGQMRRLAEAGIRVFIVAGTHDAAGQMTRALPYPDTVHLFSPAGPETRIVESLQLAVHGQSFARAAVTENLAAGYPDPVAGHVNIGLLHTSLTGRPGHAAYAPCTLDDLANKGYDYWALGHVHQWEVVAENPPVVFPGCIQGRTIRECGSKGCALVALEPGAPAEIRRLDCDVVRWETVVVDLGGQKTMERCLDRFCEACEACIDPHAPLPVIVRAAFGGATELHNRLLADPDGLRQAVRAAALAAFGERVWIEKVTVDTRLPAVREAADPGPLRELDLLVADLAADPDALKALGDELTTLLQKLPADYRQETARIRPDDPDAMRRLVAQAHALLIRRLGTEADAP